MMSPVGWVKPTRMPQILKPALITKRGFHSRYFFLIFFGCLGLTSELHANCADRIGPPVLDRIDDSQYFGYNPKKEYISIANNSYVFGESELSKGYVFPIRNFKPNRTIAEWSVFVDFKTAFPDSIIYFDVDRINGSYGTGFIVKYVSGASDAIIGVHMVYKTESGDIREVQSKYNCDVSFEDQSAVDNLILDAIYIASKPLDG